MYDAILVPTDGSDAASAAAGRAIDLASRVGADLYVLYVADERMSPVDPSMDREAVRDLLAAAETDPLRSVVRRAERAGLDPVDDVRVGVPHEAIVDYVRERGIDLVVMGTHGRTGLDRVLLGSTTERVLRTSPAPVLTVSAASR